MGRIVTREDSDFTSIKSDWLDAGQIPVFVSSNLYYRRIGENDTFSEIKPDVERTSLGSPMPRLHGVYPPTVTDADVAAGDFPKGDRW